MTTLVIHDNVRVRRCAYCRPGEENLYELFGRWDENLSVNFQDLIGSECKVRLKYEECELGRFKIIAEETSPKLCGSNCFMLAAELLETEETKNDK